MNKHILTTFFLFFCCICNAQKSYFNSINQTKAVIENKTVTPLESTYIVEKPDNYSSVLKSFLSKLSLNELEYITDDYLKNHNHIRYQNVSTDTKTKKVGNSQPLRLYEGKSHELTISNLLDVMEEVGVSNRLFVLSQALLETGYFKSNVCNNYHNLFGLRQKNGYYRFERWEDSVVGYKNFVQYKYKGGDYIAFLKQIGYAEDPRYTKHICAIAKKIVSNPESIITIQKNKMNERL